MTRYYSPALGRFLQTDSAGTEGGLNLYAYTGNDPVNLVDPTGQWGETASTVLDYIPIVGGAKGIYEFTGQSGKKYVGQSSNIPGRLEQHSRSGKLPTGNSVITTPVPGGKQQREIAEQKRLNNHRLKSVG
ncbi:RHS repeat-associated core domain-containing protein [Xenorhabdus budapestensis]|uniref:RHS repeat-associated core domain-containing protein n=1 Tax=Xenorhabdus budapestensis TaxID=290110 RepID=UPI000C0417AC|nr:RHS repeat-associated core domain-containing protein [Xenorhabdus budapestensis]